MFELIQETEKVTALAKEDVNHFVDNLKTESFIPSNESFRAFEYKIAA